MTGHIPARFFWLSAFYAGILTSSIWAAPVPSKNSKLEIIPGEGLKDVTVGGEVASVTKFFGEPSEIWKGYHCYYKRGCDVLVIDDKISSLFFYYHSSKHSKYEGVTDKGIGADSTYDDVVKQYGKPDDVLERVVSKYGAKPGAKEVYVVYNSGIAFNFHDGKLSDVRVYKHESTKDDSKKKK